MNNEPPNAYLMESMVELVILLAVLGALDIGCIAAGTGPVADGVAYVCIVAFPATRPLL
jgi:hypothetical protein